MNFIFYVDSQSIALSEEKASLMKVTVTTSDKDDLVNAEYLSDKSENHLCNIEKRDAVIAKNCSENYFRTTPYEANLRNKKKISEK